MLLLISCLPDYSDFPQPPGRALLDEPDRHRVAVEFSIAGLDGGNDDEGGV